MSIMKEENIIKTKFYESPCGPLKLGSCDNKLCLCDWQVGRHSELVEKRLERMLKAKFADGTSTVIENTMEQLDEFFAGNRTKFDLPLLLAGTDFQKSVWKELLKIPFGQTCSYREIAQRMGVPKAVRAVANANGANSISIIIPCHRVIGSDHSLTGYAGGLETKRALLKLEKSISMKSSLRF
jgi:methylated-DNA-[protein]-cysteine S-methyltransferase